MKGFRIEKVWAFVAVENDGDEGVAAFHGPMGWMPLIAADERRLESLKPIARQIARASGKTIRLVEFSTRTDLEEIGP